MTLEGDMKIANEQNAELEGRVIELQSLNATLLSNFTAWKNANEQMEKAILDEQAMNQELTESLSAWQEANQQIGTQINAIQAQQSQTMDTLALLKEIEELKADLKQSRESLESSIIDRERLETKIQRFNKEIEEITTEKIAYQNEANLSKTLEKLNSLQKSMIEKQEKEFDEKIEKYENLMRLKDQLVVKLEDEINRRVEQESTQLRTGHLVTHEKHFETEISEARDTNEALKANLDEWRKANQSLEEMVLYEQQLNPELIQNLNEWQLTNREIQENILSQKEAFENNKSNLDLNKNQNLFEEKFDVLNQKLKEIETEREVKSNELKEFEKNLEDLREKIGKVESQVLEEQNLNQTLMDNLEEWRKANAQLEWDILERQAENSDLRNRWADAGSVKEIEEEDEIERRNVEMQQRLETLESEYNRLDTAKLQCECDMIALRNEFDAAEQAKEILIKERDKVEQELKEKLDKTE